MSDSDVTPKPKPPSPTENMMEQVELRAARMIRGKQRSYRSLWRPVAMVGLIGWTVVVPMLIGIAVGTWIDRTNVVGDGTSQIILLPLNSGARSEFFRIITQ